MRKYSDRKNRKIFLYFLIIYIFSCVVNIGYAENVSLKNSINQIIERNSNSDSSVESDVHKTDEANTRFAFVLFYMQSCPHCQRFDPILKAFSDDHHIAVLAYTLDGKSLPSFPNSFNPTQTELLKFFPTQSPVVPTLFLMDQQTHHIYPVFQGEASRYQLSQRYSLLKNKIERNQFQSSNIAQSEQNKNNFSASEQDFNYE